MLTRIELIRFWEKVFTQQQVDSPRLSAQLLLSHVLSIPRLEMLLDPNDTVDPALLKTYESLARRRANGEPVAYIVGLKEFYGIELEVTPDVLIPRPESELILDRLVELSSPERALNVLDIGTGSGALAIGCAVLFPKATVCAIDISFNALRVAQKNAVRHRVGTRVHFCQGDLLSAVNVAHFDVILANLPYVPERTRHDMPHEVVTYEPSTALFAGWDGFDCYRRLAATLVANAKSGSVLLCEIHNDQAEVARSFFSAQAASFQVVKDYAGLDRVVVVVF